MGGIGISGAGAQGLASDLTHDPREKIDLPACTGPLRPALTFWRKHRFDDVGSQIMKGWSPAQVMELDAWLARHPDPTLGAPLVK